MTISVGKRAGNAIVPYSQATRRTKQVDLTVTGTNWTTARAKAIFYADSNNVWRMKFNIEGSLSVAAASLTLVVTGVTFVATGTNEEGQAVTAHLLENGVNWRTTRRQLASDGTGDIKVSSDTGNFDIIHVSGDVELDSEPTTYTTAANLESVTDASIYIEPASATQAGLVKMGELLIETSDGTGDIIATTSYLSGTVATFGTLPAGTYIITGNNQVYGNASVNVDIRIYVQHLGTGEGKLGASYSYNGETYSASLSGSLIFELTTDTEVNIIGLVREGTVKNDSTTRGYYTLMRLR